MLEHIFRNINDIRVFDVMVEFVLSEEEVDKCDDTVPCKSIPTDVVDIDEIMDLLDYNEYKRIEVEDSVDHLVRQKILGIKKVMMEGKTGCTICKYTDRLKIPRMGDHKTHLAEEVSIGYVNNYYMISNDITRGLRSGAFSHIILTLGEKIEEDDNKTSGENHG